MSKSILHKADSRGLANHGWLKSRHTFSFADYYNPERVNFGALRVLNDDYVEGGMGFSTHPHDNMEIISIPLEGDLEHKDSMGNTGIIKKGDIQVMSAGTGVHHSEHNKNAHTPVKFLQIWIFPNERGVKPRYGQVTLDTAERQNKLQQIVYPYKESLSLTEDKGVWIHQNAWMNLGDFDENISTKYSLHNSGNGVYFFVIRGSFEIEDTKLAERDGFGVWDTDEINIKSTTNNGELLVIEVPMN
ncbi:MAG: pirin family protein [Omnitrophica WOR_2 bacterium]|jgi:redox-sensitive bicupin YhaK (pirin superfamily)